MRKGVASMLYSFAKPHRGTFGLVFVCTVLAIAADLLQPYLVKIAIDDHLMAGDKDERTLLLIAGVYLGLSVIGLVFTYLQNNLLQFAGQSIIAQIRKRLFRHLTNLSVSFFDRVPRGSLITNVSSDTETLNQFFSQVLLSLMRDGMTLILILVIMFQLDPTLATYCLILLPIIGAIAVAFRSYMRNIYQQARSRLSRLIAFTAENLAGMNLIQVFHQEREQQEQFTKRNRSYFRANLQEIRTNVLFNRSFEIVGNASVAFLVWAGGNAVLDRTLEFGVLYAFITYIRQFFQPISNITQQWNTFQSTAVSVQRIGQLFEEKPDVLDSTDPASIEPAHIRGEIVFDGIAFAYQPDIPVIRRLDLYVRPGDTIGIVGATGAGKSSLISLLCRMYDVNEGSIRIDGTDIRDIPQQTLNRIVGLVQQEPFLYSGSILDNVRLFDESIPRAEVVRACELVGADPLIRRMKHGYDTRISESGSGLAAGERQLISFARIIVFRPRILILDEATANLDSYSEQLIQHALQVVSKDRTTLIIAHRLSTIRQADRIIVMKDGEIVEQGNHLELLSQHGYYEELYLHSQGKGALSS